MARQPGTRTALNAKIHLGPAPGGGSGAQLYQAQENDKTYVVKLGGNPQGTRVLFNDYVGGRIGELLAVPVGETVLVHVPATLLPPRGQGHSGLTPGMQFGVSMFPYAQTDQTQLRMARNFADFCGVVVLDTFISLSDSRQTLVYPSDGSASGTRDMAAIFDMGHAFTGSPAWSTTTLSSQATCHVKDDVGIKRDYPTIGSYEPFLQRLEALEQKDFEGLVREVPLSEWQVNEEEAAALVDWLARRKKLVREAITNYLR